MSRRTLNLLLSVAFVASVALNWAVRRDSARPNREFFPEMVRSPRYNAFSPNPNFADGKTLQPPVPGTVPRGYLPIHYRATPQDAARAGEELQNPFSREDARAPIESGRALERGAHVYTNFCQPCHGSAARGNGPVVLRGYPAPPSLLGEKALKMKDGQMFHILSYGQGNMPLYSSQLPREDRWQVIVFVRSLQRQAAPPSPGGRP